MAGAAEEAREEVEGVVRAGATALLVLLDAFVAVLVVDLARLGLGEGVVGFGDGDEFLVRGVVAAGVVVSLARLFGKWKREQGKGEWEMIGTWGKYGFLSGWYCLLSLR